ncbi:MAG: tyrosine-type recombinase/integrase [Firmicutes bacterium]|nr:tyrosine-type recombinase/integrase [Bacillota bacterium]
MPSIRKQTNKNGTTYKITVTSGRDITGKQVRHFTTYKPEPGTPPKQAEKQAAAIALDFEQKINAGFEADNKIKFASYAEYVLKLKEQGGAKPSTIDSYRQRLQRVNEAIGHLKVVDIRPRHLNAFYANLAESGMNEITGRELSAGTIRQFHGVISVVLQQAEKEMIVPYNAASKATPPKLQLTDAETLQPNEIITTLHALEHEPIKWQAMIQLFLVTGARRGEMLALKWRNVDWDNSQIKIETTLLYSKNKGLHEGPTKTNNIRFVKIPLETLKILKKYQTYYLKLRLKNGLRWQNLDYIFPSDSGTAMTPNLINLWLKKFTKRHDLPKLTPHKFRHTMASILYFTGVDGVTISKRLGHANVSTTANIYSHIIKQADEIAADAIADAILRPQNLGRQKK